MTEPRQFTAKRYRERTPLAGMKKTIALVAQAARNGSKHLPIILHARKVMARAKPKDYEGQAREVYKDFIQNWRYVRDPVGLETVTQSPDALWRGVMGKGGGLGEGLGAGDCDEAAAATAAVMLAGGFPVRFVTTRPKRSRRRLFSHIFIQAQIPRKGWITIDPVGHPDHAFGWIQPHSAIAYWGLNGELLSAEGIDPRNLAGDRLNGAEERANMEPAINHQWQDVGLAGVESFEETGAPLAWDEHGLKGFGCYAGTMGYIPDANHMLVEVDESNVVDNFGNVRTPMIELTPNDYQYVNRMRVPFSGMLGLGDDGQVYEFDGLGSFWKKIGQGLKKVGKGIRKVWKRPMGLVKRVGNRVMRGVEKLLKKTKFGRWVIRLKNRILTVALKILKPLSRVVGKWGIKLAPLAALIPGAGPIIAGYMVAAGEAAHVMDKYGVDIMETLKTGDGRKVRQINFKDPRKGPAFKAELARLARNAQNLPKEKLQEYADALRKSPYIDAGGIPRYIPITKKEKRDEKTRQAIWKKVGPPFRMEKAGATSIPVPLSKKQMKARHEKAKRLFDKAGIPAQHPIGPTKAEKLDMRIRKQVQKKIGPSVRLKKVGGRSIPVPLSKKQMKARHEKAKRIYTKLKRKHGGEVDGLLGALPRSFKRFARPRVVRDPRHLVPGTREHKQQLRKLGVRAGLRKVRGPGLVREIRAQYMQDPIPARAVEAGIMSLPAANRFKAARTTRFPLQKRPASKFAQARRAADIEPVSMTPAQFKRWKRQQAQQDAGLTRQVQHKRRQKRRAA